MTESSCSVVRVAAEKDEEEDIGVGADEESTMFGASKVFRN